MNYKNRNFGLILLSVSSLIWGFGTLFLHDTLQTGSFTLNAFASLLGGVLAFILSLSMKIPFENQKNPIIPGILSGMALFIAISFLKYGINDFCTTSFVVFVPLFCILCGHKISLPLWGTALMTFAGIYVLTHLNGLFTIKLASWPGIFASMGFAAHIMLTDRYAQNVNLFKLGYIQCFTVCILSFISMVIFEKGSMEMLQSSTGSVIYLGIFIFGIALLLQLFAQKYTEASICSVYLSYRVLFSALVSMIFLGTSFSGFFMSGVAITLCGFLFHQRELLLNKDGDLIKK